MTMKLSGIQDLLKFVQHLDEISEAPWYRLRRTRDDTVMVEISIVGIRLEVDFFEDHVEYSVFEGDESVHDDQERLFANINSRNEP